MAKDAARPLGPKVAGWQGAAFPDGRDLVGRHVRLERLDPARHQAALWQAMAGQDLLWDYLAESPPQHQAAFRASLDGFAFDPQRVAYAVCLPDAGAVGYACYWTIAAPTGSIEVGNINFSPRLQRTIAASEAMYLMMAEAFALGFRRYEWKCNALNTPSRRAAQRLGFSWEGIFRQHLVIKGRNRDTAWLAMTDADWPQIRAAFETWLAPDNFGADGQQCQSLASLTRPHLAALDPDLS